MKHFLIPFLSIVITSYFVYHGIYGHRGILRLHELKTEYVQAVQSNDNLQQQVADLRLKVEAIKNQSKDVIEEELMRVLNMGHPDDVILLDETT